LEELVNDLDARADPLELGLGDDELVGARLKELLAGILPVYNASLTLTAGCWSSRSRGRSIQALPAGSPCPPGHRCIAAFPIASDDADSSLARFLAWPLTHALIVRLASADHTRTLIDAARARIGSSDTIALVLDDRTLQRRGPGDLPRLQELSRRAVRMLAHAGEKLDPLLDGLASNDRTPLVPWLQLDPNDVMIVPRQGALARRASFLEEAEGLLRQFEVIGRLDAQARSLS
jgi:hypothetical protein